MFGVSRFAKGYSVAYRVVQKQVAACGAEVRRKNNH